MELDALQYSMAGQTKLSALKQLLHKVGNRGCTPMGAKQERVAE